MCSFEEYLVLHLHLIMWHFMQFNHIFQHKPWASLTAIVCIFWAVRVLGNQLRIPHWKNISRFIEIIYGRVRKALYNFRLQNKKLKALNILKWSVISLYLT